MSITSPVARGEVAGRDTTQRVGLPVLGRHSLVTVTELATSLRAVVRGDVVTGDESSFAAAAFGLAGDLPPELVVVATDSADIAATVRAAIRTGRRIVVQTAGQPGLVTAERTIVVITRLLAAVRIDEVAGTARVGAGSTWRQVMDAADRFALAAVPGPSSDVPGSSRPTGPVGRTFGFAVAHVRSLQLVTAAGELLEIDRHRDPELFGAARRAGGTGWVTALTIDLVPAERMSTGRLWFDAADADAVRSGWNGLSATLPATAHSWIIPLELPSVHEVPAPLRGRSVLAVRYVHLRRPDLDGEQPVELLDQLRAIATPLLDATGVRQHAPLGPVRQH